jgi:hypothetical protein
MVVRAIGADRVTIEFDPTRRGRLEAALQRLPVPSAVRLAPPGMPPSGKSAFYKYRRSLTPAGGILINFRDADRRWRITILRVILWTAMTYAALWLIRNYSPLDWILNVAGLVLAGIINWWIVRRPIPAARSIEIRADCMIIDGADVFWQSLIEDNWPEMQLRKDEDPDDWGLCGIYGTRFVEFATAYRFDKHDRTPEVLAIHVQDALIKLWPEPGPDDAGPVSGSRRRRG